MSLQTASPQNNSHKLFSIKQLPMDMARLVCSILVPALRVKRLTPDGKKYCEKIKGGAIIAANHTSFLDPFVVGVTFWYRRLFFLVAEIVMKGKLRSLLLSGVGAIRIDRNAADIEAINSCVQKLKDGYLLSVFPQGQIHKNDDVGALKSGAILMASRSNVPVIPIYIAPRKHWYERKTVIIGEAVKPWEFYNKKMPSASDIKKVTDALAEELNRCKSSVSN